MRRQASRDQWLLRFLDALGGLLLIMLLIIIVLGLSVLVSSA